MSSSVPSTTITEKETTLRLRHDAGTTTKGKDKFFEDVHFLGDKDGKVKIRSPPQFDNPLDARKYQMQHLAVAFRVFAKQGFDEGVAGHISLRDPLNPEHFWINPLSTHFSQIKVSDLVLVNEHGEVQPGGAQSAINGPAFAIHSEIHKARPDLDAACHAHSVYGKAFSCFGRVIEPLYQDALRFYNDLSVYNAYGGTVVSTEEGARIAKALGPKNRSIILRNHGIITCGHTVDEAAFLFIALDRCCHSQMMANAAVGPGWEKIYIDTETAEMTHKKSGNPSKMWLAFQPYYDQVIAEDPRVLE
ncbi:probable ribulose-5-phosphate 4-epimerase and related epimerases and aldolases [Phialocephala subalpina]|uniref:Probable ribulose-5-phosphate 4-epimerase and related epimerases and aldolases n=1 Tax=Phialocephala subalpina TaxID=576137 RepID=A0A1L7XNA5_9HELO|nr:probable ribulose-5-phosphate 4-epimerase and related epimerases and aldolases [Phialocephala subalpina]